MKSPGRPVNGPEKALDVMYNDLARSTRRITDTNATGFTCCVLPSAVFFESKDLEEK